MSYGRDFDIAWNDVACIVHETAREKGWWDTERNDYEMLALVHSEISEAVEALRKGNPQSENLPDGITAVEEELADAVIRIMDMGFARGYCIAGALMAKMRYNMTRGYRHGGKRA